MAYRCSKELFYYLLAPPRVLAGQQLPGIGLHPNLEEASVPQATDIEATILEILAEVP